MVTLLLIGMALLSTLLALGMFWSIFSQFSRDFVPFVPLSPSTLAAIYDELQLDRRSTLYDLGCGDARILRYCRDRMPEAAYKGYEIKWEALTLAYAKNSDVLSDKFSIRRKNFFKENLGDATHLVLYLLPKTLDALLPKLERELKPGTRVITADFHFAHKEPEKTVLLKKPRRMNGTKLFVYVF